MIDAGSYGNANLIQRDYGKIESTIVDMYAKLNIKSFPIDPFYIAEQMGYKVFPFSQIPKEALEILCRTEKSGTSGRTRTGRYKIFYDDTNCETRQRFTIMHEIGHILLVHKEDSEYAEKCANYFASYSLAPTLMIDRLGCEDFIDIAIRFNISDESALYAFDRFVRWVKYTRRLKSHEIKLEKLFS